MKPNRPTDIDDNTAEALVTGRVSAGDAPPGYGPVADLLRDVRAGAGARYTASDLEARTIAAMTEVILEDSGPLADGQPRRSGLVGRRLATKVAALGAFAILSAGTAAAAATGSLPSGAQGAAATVLAKVGISVPRGNGNGHGNGNGNGQGNGNGNGKSGEHSNSPSNKPAGAGTSNGPSSNADFGLCNAQAKSDGHPSTNATVFPSQATCATVDHPGQGTPPADPGSQGNKPDSSTPPVSTGKPADPGSQGRGGKPDSTPAGPPVSTPASGKSAVTTPNGGSASTTSPGNSHQP